MRQKFKASEVSDLFPEYIILKVNDFNRWSKVALDQWLYFLATSDIPADADAPGLIQAREKLKLMKMTHEDQVAYDRYMMDRAILRNTMVTARDEGIDECFEKGLIEGRSEEKKENARQLKRNGVPLDIIAKSLGLSMDEVNSL